ncbi:hypothetical protein [Mycobacterium sp. URHB0044]|jgi:hypothetical protein|uniref:hypothetical protein n=1 Tax=Mycobacterium sp. URHB0044 TaxID=1380386 RepID=UPI00048DC8E1|nr:hypothetical protein [Mycobacterium sp. URHB0044]
MGMQLAEDRRTSELLDEFRSWMADAGDPYPDDTVANAAVFADWQRTHAGGGLGAVDEDQIVDFLLDWCPPRMTIDAEESTVFCASIGAFLEFLGDTGRLAGGSPRGAGLSHLTASLAGAVHQTSTSPNGSSKALLTHPGFNPPGKPRYIELLAQPNAMSEDELTAELRSRMAAFKALPVEQQAAALDQVLDEEPGPLELPFLYIPPPLADVESVAAQAPMLATIDALRDYLGESGKPLTERGNIKRADGKALIDLLDTGDEMDPTFGDRTFRTSTTEHLPGLNSIVNIAKKAGAVRVRNRRLTPVKAWSRTSATDRATAVYNAIIELGALGSRGQFYEFLDTVHELLDGCTVHWLARILDPDVAGDVDELVELVEPALRNEVEPYWPQWSETMEGIAQSGVSNIFQTLEAVGVIDWTERRQIERHARTLPIGGIIRLTALGRHVVAHPPRRGRLPPAPRRRSRRRARVGADRCARLSARRTAAGRDGCVAARYRDPRPGWPDHRGDSVR